MPHALFTSNGMWRLGSHCSVVRRPVRHQQGCLGKLSHIAFACIQEKQESLVDLFRSPVLNALQVWCFPQTGKCLPSNLRRTPQPVKSQDCCYFIPGFEAMDFLFFFFIISTLSLHSFPGILFHCTKKVENHFNWW